MACGGAFYLLGESEFLIAGEDATFFDPHTTYGMVSAFETVHMAQRMPYGEIARMALMGSAERISARRAHETGLVSEVTEPGGALAAALRAAAVVAGHPTEAVQGTVRALWSVREAARARGAGARAAPGGAREPAAGATGGAVREETGRIPAALRRRSGYRSVTSPIVQLFTRSTSLGSRT